MSLSWHDRLQVFLAPDRVAALRFGRGLRRRAPESRIVNIAAEQADEAGRAAASAFDRLLGEMGARQCRVSVVLSNHFVRYLVVPWSSRVATPEERASLAGHSFAKVFGESAQRWTARVSPAAGARATLAAAIDTDLLHQLRSAADAAGARLDSVQPLLMAVYNAWRRDVREGPLSVLVAEPGRWCWASLLDGAWRRVQSGKLGERGGVELAEIVERQLSLNLAEGETAGVGVPEIWVYAEGLADLATPAGSRWSVRTLSLPPGRRPAEGAAPAFGHALLAG